MKTRTIKAATILLLWLFGVHAIAAENDRFFADTTLHDYPFAKEGSTYNWPSMQQSLELTSNFYQLSHYYLQKIPKPTWGKILINVLFDAVMVHPIVWLHEEHHRAVMTRRQIKSRNESYFFTSDVENGAIKVSGVDDEALRLFKQEYPAEIVHLHIAGIVSQIEMNRHVEKRLFFHQTESYEYGVLWTNAIGTYSYMDTCTKASSDNTFNEAEEKKISERDFTGFDCRAWVYDLFRPTEPYEMRGVHPSGIGYDRYIKYKELTAEEKDYLKDAAGKYLLNFVDPNLFGFHGFSVGENKFNAAFRHFMTPFGQMSAVDMYLSTRNGVNFISTLYETTNMEHRGYGVELGLYRYPVAGFFLSAATSFIEQPEKLSFYEKMKMTNSTELSLSVPLSDYFEVFASAKEKSDGWIPATVYLESHLIASTGVNVKF